MPDAARTRGPAEPGAQAATTAAARAPHAPSGPARVLALQRAVGNAATKQVLSRWPLPGEELLHQHTLPDWLMQGYADARKAKDAYVASGKKGPITYDPSKRNTANYYGGFDAEYDPGLGELKISLRGAVDFVPGMVLKNGRAVAKEPSAATLAARDAINALPAADRATEINKWHWSKDAGPDAGDEADFLAKFETIVESQWSEKHAFHCERAWWQDLKAAVKIDVTVREAAKGATDHMKVLAYKVPKGQMIGQANVTRPGSATGAFANVMTVNSSKVEQRKDRLLEADIAFDPGTDTPTAGSKTRLRAVAKDMPNPAADASVETLGVSVKVQGPDPATRKTRFDAIAAELTGAGMAATRIAFVDDGAGNKAMLTVGSGAAQTSVAHESGHMFGLDDEYTGPSEYGPGKKTEHTKFVKETTGLTGVMHAKSDSIMSEGRIVRPQHYATFLDALRLVSGVKEWEFGPGVDAVGPRTGWDDRAIWGEPMGPF
jgi:hypothetical protein